VVNESETEKVDISPDIITKSDYMVKGEDCRKIWLFIYMLLFF
jgi:hypothetical protein